METVLLYVIAGIVISLAASQLLRDGRRMTTAILVDSVVPVVAALGFASGLFGLTTTCVVLLAWITYRFVLT